MKISFDRGVRALYFEFEPKTGVQTVEESAELICNTRGRLAAIKVSLENVTKEFREIDARQVAARCLDAGWILSERSKTPWVSFEFRPTNENNKPFHWTANVDVEGAARQVTGIEVLLDGAASFVQPPNQVPKRIRLWLGILTPRRRRSQWNFLVDFATTRALRCSTLFRAYRGRSVCTRCGSTL